MADQGRYVGNLTAAALGQTEKGAARVVLTFAVPEVGDIFVFLYLSDAAKPYTFDKLAKLGFNGNWDAPEFTTGDNVSLTCKHEEYQGKVQEKWDVSGGISDAPVADDLKARLTSEWRAEFGSKPAAKPAAGGPPRPAPKAPPAKAAPKAPAPPAAATVFPHVVDADTAWAEIGRLLGKDPDETTWHTTVANVEKLNKKLYDKFAAADWQAVVGNYPPF